MARSLLDILLVVMFCVIPRPEVIDTPQPFGTIWEEARRTGIFMFNIRDRITEVVNRMLAILVCPVVTATEVDIGKLTLNISAPLAELSLLELVTFVGFKDNPHSTTSLMIKNRKSNG